ncbi:MAG: cation:proton antiporter, partial [Chloroflexota bacterium]
MSEVLGLLRDFAIIMVAAGAITILFRLIHQPAILGYILVGVIVGPFTIGPTIQNMETIRQLADLGIVLVMFGLGLEFSPGRLLRIGLSALAMGTLKMLFMLVMGYEVGLLLGWSPRDALFLGAALSISSTMVIVKVLAELGRLRQEASHLMVSILVIEDFAAIAIIALFSSIATTGRADLAGAGVVVLKLGLFAISAIGFSLLLGPRLLELAHRAGQKAVLITGLALCFALALLSQKVGLSVAAGAFLMGSIIATTPRSEEMLKMVTPLRDIFAALFFVAMGMLLDIRLLSLFLLPALLIFLFNLLGKVFSLALGSFLFGYSVKTALRLGTGMVAVGEFSLIIVKVGLDAGVLGEAVFPVVVALTLLTIIASPYLMRLSEPMAEWLEEALPRPVQEYFTYSGLVERAFRRFLRRAEPLAQES